MDSDYLFANVLQRSAFEGRLMVVCSATRTATVATAESLGERAHREQLEGLRVVGR